MQLKEGIVYKWGKKEGREKERQSKSWGVRVNVLSLSDFEKHIITGMSCMYMSAFMRTYVLLASTQVLSLRSKLKVLPGLVGFCLSV